MAKDVELNIVGRDRTDRAFRSAARNVDQLKRKVNDNDNAFKRFDKTLEKFSAPMGKAVKAAGSFVSKLGLLVTGGISAGLAMVKLAVAVGRYVKAIGPALAAAPALAAGFALVAGTIKLAAPAIVAALSPVTDAFKGAQKSVGDLAAKGVKPLAAEFVKVNFPAIKSAMDRIATATNGVIVSTMQWVNSAKGQSLVTRLTNETAGAVEALRPKVEKLATSFLNMVDRVSDGRIKVAGDALGKVADKVSELMDSITKQDVDGAFQKIVDGFVAIKGAWDKIEAIGAWFQANESKIRLACSGITLAILGVALAIGAWPIAIYAAVSLVVQNIDHIKAAFDSLKGLGGGDNPITKWVQFAKAGIEGFMNGFRPFISSIVGSFQALMGSVKSAWEQWQPILNWLIPVFKAVWTVIGALVGVAIMAIIAVFRIFFGAVGALGAVVSGIPGFFVRAFNAVKGAVSAGWAAVKSAFNAAKSAISGAVSSIISTIQRVISGGINAVKSAVSGVGGAFSSAFGAAKGAVVGAYNTIAGYVNKIKDKIASIPGAGALAKLFTGADAWVPAFDPAASFSSGHALAFAGGGSSRTEGPRETNVNVSVALDGAPFAAVVKSVVDGNDAQARHSARYGRR